MECTFRFSLVCTFLTYITCSSYYYTTTPEFTMCDPEFLSGPSGTFTSPNYPDNYNNHQECTWKITVQEGKKIQLDISDIEIESHSTCSLDAIEIYDGPDESSDVLDKICYNNGTSVSIISSSNMMFVLFTTDTTVTKGGFRAKYKAICGDRVLMTGGDVEWFNFFDTPAGSPVKNALLGSNLKYNGPSKSDVTFTVEGKLLQFFLLQETIFLSKFAKEIKFTFVYDINRKKPKKSQKMMTKKIKNSSKWTPIKLKKHKKEMQRLLIALSWDSSVGKKGKKIQVQGMRVKVCG